MTATYGEISETPMDADIPDYSDPNGDEIGALSRDAVHIRSMADSDLDAIARIDRKLTGRDRRAYFEDKLAEMLRDGGVRVSLVAEHDGLVTGFIMARVDYGEYGRMDPIAVMDTIGVNPDFGRRGIANALMSQLMLNLSGLQASTIRTSIDWGDFSLGHFLQKAGFKPAQQLSLVLPIEPE